MNPVRVCLECDALLLPGSELCPVCGSESARMSTAERLRARPRASESEKRVYLETQFTLARKQGLHPNWALHRYRARFAEDPPVEARVA